MRALGATIVALLGLATGLVGSAAAAYEDFGIASVDAELSSRQAGGHPDLRLGLEIASDPDAGRDETGHGRPYAPTRSLRIALPAGLFANLNAASACPPAEFVSALGGGQGCPTSSQVGVARVFAGLVPNVAMTVPIFNLATSAPGSVARFGFFVSAAPAFVEARLRSDGDYGVTAEVEGISSTSAFQSAELTLWGVPADSEHDTQRLTVRESVSELRSSSPPRSFGRAPQPFLTNPTHCGEPLTVRFEADSYQEPGAYRGASAPLGEIVGCPRLRFEPSLSLVPTNSAAAAPSGLDVALELTQNEAVNGLATAQLRELEVRLPPGIAIAPGAADGLLACDAAQAGYGISPPRAARCPEASKLAEASVDSPSLARPLRGAVHLRTPAPGRLLRLWLLVDDLGVHAKLPGELRLDPQSGQVSAVFAAISQLPVRRLELHFKDGPRAALATPAACGSRQAWFSLIPWSGGAAVAGGAAMRFDRNCGGGGFAPLLSAGAVNPLASRFSRFVVDVTRGAGEAELASLRVRLPPGVLAKLAGVALCDEAAAAIAACSPQARVGSIAVALGPGPNPLWVPQPGRPPATVFLAGPYRGAPLSLLFRVPAQAGPFDLGLVVVRAAARIEPESAAVTVVSDPLPRFLAGVPLSYRRLHVDLDRPGFMLNPSNCEPLYLGGAASSVEGVVAALSSRFQVAACGELGFRPRSDLWLRGPRSGS